MSIGRSELKYTEAGKVLRIECDRTDASAADRHRIVHSVREAYRSAGREIRVSETC